jgi:hypothetical protein
MVQKTYPKYSSRLCSRALRGPGELTYNPPLSGSEIKLATLTFYFTGAYACSGFSGSHRLHSQEVRDV